METEGTQDGMMSAEEKGVRLSALLTEILHPTDAVIEDEETNDSCSQSESLEKVFQSAEKIRGTANRITAEGTVGPEQEVYLAEVIKEINQLKLDLLEVTNENPLLRTNLIILEKLVGEYDKLDKQIDSFLLTVTTLSGVKLTGERSRVRDNLTQLVTERWRLLNSILDNVNKLHSNIVKAKVKGSASEEEDLFSGYAKYAEGKDYESERPKE